MPSWLKSLGEIDKLASQLPSLSFKQPIGFLLALKFFNRVPDIIFDGIIDEDITVGYQPLCISNNINATFLNLDAAK